MGNGIGVGPPLVGDCGIGDRCACCTAVPSESIPTPPSVPTLDAGICVIVGETAGSMYGELTTVALRGLLDLRDASEEERCRSLSRSLSLSVAIEEDDADGEGPSRSIWLGAGPRCMRWCSGIVVSLARLPLPPPAPRWTSRMKCMNKLRRTHFPTFTIDQTHFLVSPHPYCHKQGG